MKYIFFKTIPLLLVGIVWAGFIHAQVVPDPVSLSATPSSPPPRSQVRIHASTPTFDKNAAIFDWAVDGKARPDFSGIGKDTITLPTGDVGSSIRVSVAILRQDEGEGGEASLTVYSSDLSLTWFAETYVPKWYRGKALPAQNSIVNIVAVPQISLGTSPIPTENLLYTWSLDDEEDVVSGVGNQVFRIRVSDLPGVAHDVRVIVQDSQKRIKKEGRIFLTPSNPRVAVYQSSPLGGIEPRASPSFIYAPLKELDLLVEPFFFPVETKRALSYAWNVGGNDTSGSAQAPFLLTLFPGSQALSSIPVSVRVQTQDSFFLPVSKLLTLFFQ